MDDPHNLSDEQHAPGVSAEVADPAVAADAPLPAHQAEATAAHDDSLQAPAQESSSQDEPAAPVAMADDDSSEPYVPPPEPEDDPDRVVAPLEEVESVSGPTGDRRWYILKVQTNREDTIRDALLRKVSVAGLQDYFGDIIVPIEMVSEVKNGKKRVVRRKLYPGYIVVNMELNDDTWFLVRETHGIGDFTGSGGKPTPMLEHEVAKLITKHEEKTDETPKLKINFRPGDRVKINEGTFENFEGDVHTIDEANGRVTVMINIFGRSTPVELEYWQVESL